MFKSLLKPGGQATTWIIVIVVIIAIIVLAAVFSAQKASQPKVVKVGYMGPLTGDAASYGESIRKGIELAKEEMNLANVQLVVEDSKCEGKEAATVINKLISVDGVVAIVGEVCSGGTLAAAPIANENKVVLISPASTSPKITDAGEYVFRTVPSDALQGNFGAKLAYDKGFRKLAVLYSNEEYGVGFNKVVSASFKDLGGEVVANETFERGVVDLRTQLTKIKSANPDVIYIISNSPDSAVAALKQIKELDIKAAIFGSEGLKSSDIVEGAGLAAEGLLVTSVSSGTTDFAEKHQTKYGTMPGPFAAQAYDAFKAIALAIQDGAQTGEAIKDKVAKVEFDGASGHIKFDAHGDVAGNYDVYVVKAGKFVLEGKEAAEAEGESRAEEANTEETK